MNRTRLIVVALIGVIGVGVLALAASLAVPYNVSFGALMINWRGAGTCTREGQPPTPLSENAPHPIPAGCTIRLEPDSQATLKLELNNGYITLTGPATWTLVEAHRRATSLGHMLQNDHFTREYVLVMSQAQGTAYYDFSGTSPHFEDVSITVELPQMRYVPSRPCWEITVQPDGTAQAADVTCR